jgi:hypothetical protein
MVTERSFEVRLVYFLLSVSVIDAYAYICDVLINFVIHSDIFGCREMSERTVEGLAVQMNALIHI